MNSRGRVGKFVAWLKIARLQFYPMTGIAYTVGAVASSIPSHGFNWSLYLTGYLILFLIEFCTVLVNEYNDYETDRLNNNFSVFTGGTRVLVEGSLSFREVRTGIIALVVLVLCLGYVLNMLDRFHSPLAFSLLILTGLFLGLGYTMPPVQFSYRGLGEIVVSVTHSIYVILCGFVFQGGTWDSPLPWLISIPLLLSVFAAITLAGLPDRQADDSVGKGTIAVLFGPRAAVWSAILSAGAAYLSALILWDFRVIAVPLLFLNLLVLPHGAFLIFSLFKLMKRDQYGKRIDREMALSLAYIIWFGVIPLFFLR